MNFPTNIYLVSALGAFLTTLATLPLWRGWCRRHGHLDDPGHRKIHEEPVPLAGGLAVLTGLLVPLTVGVALLHFEVRNFHPAAGWLGPRAADALTYGLGKRSVELLALLLGAVGMAVLGWLDDKHELRPAKKFLGQLLIATLVAAAGIRITLFVPSVLFSYAATVLWILTVTNAFNFMDNMNGLCAGLGAIAALLLGLTAALHDQYLVAALAFFTCGAVSGFLPFNFPRATAFLGDAGSHLIGFLLAVLAILPHFHTAKDPHPWAVFSPLLILAVPLADLVWVVILRWRLGQPFYVGDNNHLSHRLVRLGLSKTVAVVVIWAVAAAVGSVALSLN